MTGIKGTPSPTKNPINRLLGPNSPQATVIQHKSTSSTFLPQTPSTSNFIQALALKQQSLYHITARPLISNHLQKNLQQDLFLICAISTFSTTAQVAVAVLGKKQCYARRSRGVRNAKVSVKVMSRVSRKS
jgi:hypothetical protein